MSSRKKMKHINAKFFFIKDRVDDGEIKVINCPTKEMWVDIMTKQLQGTAFHVMRAELMYCPVNYEHPSEEEELSMKQQPIPAPKTVIWKSVVATTFKKPQECVGQNKNHQAMTDNKDRYHGRTKFLSSNQQRTKAVARLATDMWRPVVRKQRIARQWVSPVIWFWVFLEYF